MIEVLENVVEVKVRVAWVVGRVAGCLLTMAFELASLHRC